jgi:hypothetical protein
MKGREAPAGAEISIPFVGLEMLASAGRDVEIGLPIFL